MKIIDAFCGVGPWQQRDHLLPYKLEDTLALIDHFGIAQALVHSNGAVTTSASLVANAPVIEAAQVSPRFLPSFAVFPHPHRGYPGVDDHLAAMRTAGARAAWLFPGYLRSTQPWQVGELTAALAAHRVPLFVRNDQWSPNDLATLMEHEPALRVVLVGGGYMEDPWTYPLLRRHPHFYICIGQYYNPDGDPERFIAHHGAERLIFGSGLPHFSPGGLIAHVMYAPISDEEKALILAGNLERLLAEVTL